MIYKRDLLSRIEVLEERIGELESRTKFYREIGDGWGTRRAIQLQDVVKDLLKELGYTLDYKEPDASNVMLVKIDKEAI